jgi:pimeloyl-ACP methyl ester carboxylesterase
VTSSSSSSASTALVDVPIQITVHDINRSLLRCKSSGATYEVAGRLIAPSKSVGSAVTLYLSGVLYSGMFEYHNDLVPGYDFTRAMAQLGQTSVVIDRVAYGLTRPYPANGDSVCLGSQADTVHQVISALRNGSYTVQDSSMHPAKFSQVAVAGYSIGWVIAELEEASFNDQNALILISWADQGMSNYGTSFKYVYANCMPGSPKPPGGQAGYFFTLPAAKIPPLLSPAADPRVVATLIPHKELDPCGQELNGAAWFSGLDTEARQRIHVPVLIIYGDYDVLFTPQAWPAQFAAFTGTRDRTLIGIPDGQMLMLDRHVPLTRREIAGWLAGHGL